MKIIEPSYEIITPFGPLTSEIGIQMLRFIERMARISHRSENQQTDDSWQDFIKAVVLKHGDWSVVEHCSITVIFRVDRGVTHELVRHRLFSFTQESTRFVRYGKQVPELEFIRPIELRGKGAFDDLGSSWQEAMLACEREYFILLNQGARPQEARSVLPNATAAVIAMTGNLRSWRWFFQARCTTETHPDMRRVTIALLWEFKNKIPLLYDDLEVNQKQSISMSKVH